MGYRGVGYPNQVEAEPDDVANHVSENIVAERVVKDSVAEVRDKSESSAESEPVKIEKKEEFNFVENISIDSLDEDEFHDAIDEVRHSLRVPLRESTLKSTLKSTE